MAEKESTVAQDTTAWPEFVTGAGPSGRRMLPPMASGSSPFIAMTTDEHGTCLQVTAEQYKQYWEPLMRRVFTRGFVEGYDNLKKDKDTAVMITNQLLVFNLLSMPVETSPLVVAAGQPRRMGSSTSAFTSLYELYMLHYAVTHIMYDKDKDGAITSQVALLDALLEKEIQDSGITLDATLRRHVFEPEFNREIGRREAVTRFARIMEMYTLWMINRMEVFIYEALALGFKPADASEKLVISELAVMTPHTEPTGLLLLKTDPTGAWWGRCNQTARYMFNMRTHLYNSKMVQTYAERGRGEVHTPVDPWCLDDYEQATYNAFYEECQMRQQGNTDPSPVLYRQWIRYSTLEAYMDFINYTYK